MAVKVVRVKGPITIEPMKTECENPECRADLEYHKEDVVEITQKGAGMMGDHDTFCYIVCPNCSKQVCVGSH